MNLYYKNFEQPILQKRFIIYCCLVSSTFKQIVAQQQLPIC